MGPNKINQLWNLADTFTVEQAAALIAGFDPCDVCFSLDGSAYFRDIETGLTYSAGISGAITAFSALKNAIDSGNLKAKIHRYERGNDIDLLSTNEPAWNKTTVSKDELTAWMKSRGVTSGFFFPETHGADSCGYLDPKHPRYAPKLAAAVRAWESTTDLSGRSPKKALEKWLREHAAEFGMTDEDGNPVNTAIEEAAKVANWQPGGGAPKTPGG